MGLVLGLGKRLGSTLHITPTSGGLTMGPMGHVPGPPTRGAAPRAETFLKTTLSCRNGPVCGVRQMNTPHDTFQSSHVAFGGYLHDGNMLP